jgi:hypothetical protein
MHKLILVNVLFISSLGFSQENFPINGDTAKPFSLKTVDGENIELNNLIKKTQLYS